jgi:hypothetical protein
MKFLLGLRTRRLFTLLLLPLAGCMNVSNPGSQSSSQGLNAASSVYITSSASSVTQGQAVTLEASVSPSLATGTVTFYNGSNAIGTAAINSAGPFPTALAFLTTSFSSIGAQSITAHYSGSVFYASSQSGAITIGVYNSQLASTSTTLQASTPTPQYQTGVTLTATVSPSSATGTVTFYNGSADIGSATLNAGTAVLTTAFAAGGATTLHAVYSGDYNYLSSTSNSIAMNISGPLVTATTLQASTSATAIGDNVTLTANLAPAAATGTVTFYNGSTAIGTANVNSGVATLTTAFSSSGKISLKAVFNANSSYESSTSNIVSLFVTGVTPDTVVLQATPSSVIIGYSATLTATITPSAATGTISFYDGSVLIGSAPVVVGIATLSNVFMSAGSQSLTAVYSGDTTYISTTSSPVTLTVGNPGPTPTVTTLILSTTSAYAGDTVTLTVSVAPSMATGQVSFVDNNNVLASVLLASGTASYSTTFATVGSHNITALYDGDTVYSPSASSPQVLTINNPPPPTCPIDPSLCSIECPADPLCPFGASSGTRNTGADSTDSLRIKEPAFRFDDSSQIDGSPAR